MTDKFKFATTFVHGLDLSFTGTTAGSFLANNFPAEWTPHTCDVHTLETFDSVKRDCFGEIFFGLGGILWSPVGVSKSGETVTFVFVKWPGNMAGEEVGILMVVNAIIAGALEVFKKMFGASNVPIGGITAVLTEEAGGDGNVRTGIDGDPVDGAHELLEKSDLACFVFFRNIIMGNVVYGKAGTVRTEDRVGIGETKTLEDLVKVTFLGDVEPECAGRVAGPVIVTAEVVRDSPHKINSKLSS